MEEPPIVRFVCGQRELKGEVRCACCCCLVCMMGNFLLIGLCDMWGLICSLGGLCTGCEGCGRMWGIVFGLLGCCGFGGGGDWVVGCGRLWGGVLIGDGDGLVLCMDLNGGIVAWCAWGEEGHG